MNGGLRTTYSAVLVALVLAFLWTNSASASEISFVSGLYKSETNKADGDKTLGKNTLQVGARYGEPYADNFHWFGQGMLQLQSYTGPNAPSNSTGLTLRGGMRMYFPEFSDKVIPFASASAGYQASKDATPYTETEVSGLFYWGDLGLRLAVGQDYFMEVETSLFKSALWATTKTKPVGTNKDPETERTQMELFVDSRGAFDTTTIGAGMKF